MQGNHTISGPTPFAYQLTNPKATGEDHIRAAKATLNFAGRTVANAAYNQLKLVFNFSGTVGGAIGSVFGAAGGLVKGCYHKAVHSGSDAAKKPLTEYMVKGARAGYLKGDYAGRISTMATLPIHGPLAILSGAIGGGIIAAVSSPIVYLQARDNTSGHSDMADCVEDCNNWVGDRFDEMNDVIYTGESKRTRRAREEENLYKHIDLSYDPLPIYQMAGKEHLMV